jgi:uncharacterized membrane-anchored protein
MGLNRLGLAGLALCLIAGATRAAAPDAPPSAAERAEIAKAEALLKSLHPTHGDIKLPGADATLHLGDRYYFLGPADAKRVLVEGWGNPPDAADGVLGLVFPAGASPLGDTWGAVVTYDNQGYVSDAEAKTTDYGKLLESMRSNEDQVNDERKKQNIPAIHLVGWAQAPVYDPAHHSLIWARDIQFADQKIDTLNYDVRELGRRGVLSLNIVYRMPDLASVRTAATDLGAVTGFDPGARYTDYQNGVDKRAAYGVAGLVAAGAGVALAQKAGLLALLLLFLKKGFVVIIAGGAALFARIKAAFRKKTV